MNIELLNNFDKINRNVEITRDTIQIVLTLVVLVILTHVM